MTAPHPDLARKIENTKNIVNVGKHNLIPGLHTKYPQDYVDIDTYTVLDKVKPWADKLPYGTVPQNLYPLQLSHQTIRSSVPIVRDRILVVCVDFPDKPATVALSDVYNRFFSLTAFGGSTLANYYKEISYNKHTPEGIVRGWYRAPHNLTYYANGTYGMGNEPNGITLFTDIWNQVENDPTIDWSYIDANNDNNVNYLMIVHSGYDASATGNVNDIWPQALGYGRRIGTTDKYLTNALWNIAIVAEKISGNSSYSVTGTYCHEYGHLLGLLDLYFGSSTADAQLGNFSLMANGSWLNGGTTPCHLDAYSKHRVGFTDSIINASGTITVPDSETNSTDFLYTTINYDVVAPPLYGTTYPDSRMYEYFIVSNRQNKLFDLYIPANGIFIYHVRELFYQGVFFTIVELKQADGRTDLQGRANLGDSGDSYPGSTNKRSFGKSTNPNTELYP